MMEQKSITIDELKKLIDNMNSTYYLADLWKVREHVLKFPVEQLYAENLISAIILIRILEGNLEEARRLTETIPRINNSIGDLVYKITSVILPDADDEEFKKRIKDLQASGLKMVSLTFTAGRLSLINGFRDFTQYGPKLQDMKTELISALDTLYSVPSEVMFNIASAEYKYQTNHCLEAMVSVVEEIPKIEKLGDIRILFVALSLRMKILVMNGEVDSASKLVKEIRNIVNKYPTNELKYNLDAMETRIAMYEGKYDLVMKWMENSAPDEFTDFCMLDLYRYMVKIRCYILTGKFMAGLALCEKLRPLLKKGHRNMDLCELDILIAIGGYKANMMEETFAALERALALASNYNYLRLVADEGQPVLKVLTAYRKTFPNSEYLPFIYQAVEISRRIAAIYPEYLVPTSKKKVSLTIHEVEVLTLLSQGLTYEEIAGHSNVSINTVRYHIKKIYENLDVNSSSEAIIRAKNLGLL